MAIRALSVGWEVVIAAIAWWVLDWKWLAYLCLILAFSTLI
jgi:hypothetical protein